MQKQPNKLQKSLKLFAGLLNVSCRSDVSVSIGTLDFLEVMVVFDVLNCTAMCWRCSYYKACQQCL